MTQHYADFERQIVILNGGKSFDERRYRERIEEVVRLILASVGLQADERSARQSARA